MAITWVDSKTVEVETIEEYFEIINVFTTDNIESKYVYRGQKQSTDPINCSATRRFIKSGYTSVTKEDLFEYVTDILEKAKKIGLQYKDGREIFDFELLADLQHHGCATILSDFTWSASIALFFASEQSSRNQNSDSAVYVIEINNTKRFKELRYKDICEDTCLKEKLLDKDYLFFWEPTTINKRILTQRSVFIFGEPEILSNDIFLKIIIKNKHCHNKNIYTKKIILNELDKMHNISSITLFNDLSGFSYANNQDVKIEILSPIYLITKARENMQIENYDLSLKYYNKYIDQTINIPNFKAIFERAEIFYKQKKFKEAINDYDIVITLKPKFAEAYYNRGNAKLQINFFNEAIEDFNISLQLNPNLTFVYISRGVAKERLGFLKEAILDYDLSIKLNQDNTIALNNRGYAYYLLENYDQAVIDCTAAINAQPDYALAYNNRGIAKAMLNMNLEALDDYNQAIEFDPSDSKAYYNRGAIYGRLKEYEKEIVEYDIAIGLNPKFQEAYFNRGVAKKDLGIYNAALEDFIELSNIDSNNVSAYINQSVIFLLLEQFIKAKDASEKAIERNPQNPAPFIYRSVSNWLINEKEKSRLDFLKAKELALEENHERAIKELDNLFSKEGILKEDWKAALK